MNPKNKQTALKLILSAALISQITACVPVVVGGAAAGGAMAADRRTSGIFVEDQNIELKAIKKMETNLGEDAHVNVTSYNRNVLLTGEVPIAESKTKAESLIKEIANIRAITNEITVGPKSTLGSRSNDSYITTKIKTKFVTENKFPANYVKVVTENGVVYLLGIVSSAEADAAAEIARNTEGVTKVVKVFEYMP
ncbi:BON domain-containing protein [Methylotenera sp.]|uniref:BON domain-containing protein n=2 Tax=Methylotenera sp. TaxID=2051956 RepID=UPI002719F9C8|nr:BON domain-containing protein [Methylotenera sp.]MDO9206410.1 BON domain-containing protein [Methylotenera sp.]MDP1521823.1 BON domain-containing protein [Methylotenera sp.]MDP3309010.1 BON domain-containing protein [Methylotenera sp.]MDP3818454.1 BON domain-containing protein [Methylotenera sp.]MDZ4212404.1 BON domain-containing protein [Methylotenera sp.]